MLVLSNVTFVNVRTPLAATMPNSATPAPPSTGSGMPSTTAAILGSRPSSTRMMPAPVATWRVLTPVMATSPTFCANAVYGNVLKTPPITVPSPSARSPSASLPGVIFSSTISPTATMSPVVSVMMTIATISRAMTELTWKLGSPNWNGVTMPNQL